jgi:hypothetical protein
MKKQPVHMHTEFGLKRVGTYITQDDGVKILRCPRKKSIHYMHSEGGWAVDQMIVDRLRKKPGLDLIVIDEEEEKQSFIIDMANFLLHAKIINHGHGNQYLVKEYHWTDLDRNTITLKR